MSLRGKGMLDYAEFKQMKSKKQLANKDTFNRMIAMLEKEQESKAYGDYREEIKPLIDQVISSLFDENDLSSDR